MALDWCKKCTFPHYLQNKLMNVNKIVYICIDKYMILVASNANYFLFIFNRVMALDQRQNFVYVQYPVN